MKPSGRFLVKNVETGLYSDIGDRKATEKTSQALRDGASCLRRQLTEDLHDPEFIGNVFDVDHQASASASGSNKKPNKQKEKPKTVSKKVRPN